MTLPPTLQKQVLRKVDDDFIKFLAECIVNVVHGNFQTAKQEQFKTHIKILKQLIIKSRKEITRKQQRAILTSINGLKLLKSISPFIFEKFKSKQVVQKRM